ncbi:hypothetical protein CXB51_010864 [Gossypium anomalum]|uniref:Uncharacterized protein n=1 Tax=Gossypium anomalum TaxID=47600 RepID=A0A8J6D350_9ROSI|nr:hypothetical protein CXB51_010864 [Gossypium anomalum]
MMGCGKCWANLYLYPFHNAPRAKDNRECTNRKEREEASLGAWIGGWDSKGLTNCKESLEACSGAWIGGWDTLRIQMAKRGEVLKPLILQTL